MQEKEPNTLPHRGFTTVRKPCGDGRYAIVATLQWEAYSLKSTWGWLPVII